MTEDNSWRTASFRQSVVNKINEAIQSSGMASTKNGIDMENHVFQKARNKDEYLGFVARLILHVREMKNKNPQNPGGDGNAGQGGPAGVGGPGMPDPINALQNLASQGSRNPQMMGMGGSQGQQQMPQGVVAPNLLQTLTQRPNLQQQQMQQQMNMQNMQQNRMQGNMQQQGNPNSGGMGPGGNMSMGMGNNMVNQMQNAGGQMVPGGGNLQMGQQQNPQMGGMGQMQMNPAAAMMQNQMGQVGGAGVMNPNQMNQMNVPGGMNPGAGNINNMGPGRPVGQGMNQNQMMGAMNPNAMGQMGQAPGMGNPQQQQQAGGIGPVGGQMTPQQQQMLSMHQMARKPQEMMMNQPGGNIMYQQGVRQIAPSNQMYRQSPSPSVASPAGVPQQQQQQPHQVPQQMIPSPAMVASPNPQNPQMMAGVQPRSIGSMMAQSPSSVSLNTPGQPGGAVQSPLHNPQEEQIYREKYRQLTKYIEPLKRMIARMGNEENERLYKMKKLLEILSNPATRIPLETLLKCEAALENQLGSFREHQINNPLLEAVSANLQSPMGNHTLQRTFRPCLEALFGSDIKNLPPAKRLRTSTEETTSGPEIPHILQGEIARLNQKFKVSLDSSAQTGTKTIKLICSLDDKHLPCVPPISVNIPEDYPIAAPCCSLTEQEYNATPFLISVQKALMARISKLPRQFSLSHLLDTWEMSVRQACSPGMVNPTKTAVLLGI